MKKLIIVTSLLYFNFAFAQKDKDQKGSKISSKYESQQAQDFSVPPPPITIFPAQFPGGNKAFIKKIRENINTKILDTITHNLSTDLILKIDQQGNVLNISTFGSNKNFNQEIMKTTQKVTENIKWEAAKNKEGKKVIDIVRLPFVIKIIE